MSTFRRYGRFRRHARDWPRVWIPASSFSARWRFVSKRRFVFSSYRHDERRFVDVATTNQPGCGLRSLISCLQTLARQWSLDHGVDTTFFRTIEPKLAIRQFTDVLNSSIFCWHLPSSIAAALRLGSAHRNTRHLFATEMVDGSCIYQILFFITFYSSRRRTS